MIAALGRAGHQVKYARDVGLGAATDEQIAALARESDAAPIKQDMDFADVRQYEPVNILALPQWLIASLSVATVDGCTVYYRTRKQEIGDGRECTP